MGAMNFEAELLQPSPRRVKRRKLGMQNGCIQLFIVPHTLVGIGLAFSLLLQIAVVLFGTIAPGTITDLSSHRSSKGNATYNAHYEYRWNGVRYAGKNQVHADDYFLARKGQSVAIKILPLAPAWGEVVMIPGASNNGMIGVMLFITLFWNGIVGVFYVSMYGPLVKDKSLVRNGVATTGRIVDKSIARGKSTSYHVEYEYVAATIHSESVGPWGSARGVETVPSQTAENAPIRAKMAVPQSEYEALKKGQSVTILHDAKKPGRSVIYRCASYSAAP